MKLTYIKTQNLLTDTRTIIETAKQTAYRSVNAFQTLWTRRVQNLFCSLGHTTTPCSQIEDKTAREWYANSQIETPINPISQWYK